MAVVSDRTQPDRDQGVFETLLVLDGRPVELDAHLARLESSLIELFPDRDHPPLDVPVERGHDGAPSSMRIAVAPAGETQLAVRTSTHEISRDVVSDPKPVALHSLPLAGGLGDHKWVDRSLLEEAQARLPAGSLPLIVDADGVALEASRANLFAVRDGALFTPALDGRILPGVTRMRVLELSGEVGIDAHEAELSREDLLAASEVFLTGSVRGIERVRYVDGAPLGGGGDVSDRLATELWQVWAGAKAAF